MALMTRASHVIQWSVQRVAKPRGGANLIKPIDQDLIAALPQFEATLIARVLANHCRRPRYIKALARGGKRFDLNGRFKGEVTAEEQQIAQNHPCMQTNKAEAAAPAESTDAASADVKEADNN